ncbi:MAG TPA: hypothetical protein VH309_09060 [Elusimicrobiota bacterium]|jgi:hypothetical protein|nr:hypothetical protein [Elusimicrobiota bacterium]
MAFVSVAVEYIERHRPDASDREIALALREQGFSDETLTEAFRAAGDRPEGSAGPAKPSPARRALVGALFAFSALSFIASGLLFVRNFRRASAAAAARSAP